MAVVVAVVAVVAVVVVSSAARRRGFTFQSHTDATYQKKNNEIKK